MTPIDGSVLEENKIGFFGCLSYILGNCIGAGIFIAPSAVTENVGSVGLSIAVWILCGLISLLGSIVYIELGTGILEPGCDYAYICYVGWNSVAFAFMWVGVILSYPASTAVQILTFGHYIIDGMSQNIHFGQTLQSFIEWNLGIIVLVFVTWINFYSLNKSAVIFQIASTVAKLCATALIIVAGLYCFFFKGMNENFIKPFEYSQFNIRDFVFSINAGFYAYSGWDVLNYSSNEIRNPSRNMPSSLLLGISLVILLYTLMIFSYFVALTPQEVLKTNAIAALFSQKVFGPFYYVVPFMIAVLICGSLNSNLFCSSRYVFCKMKKNEILPLFSFKYYMLAAARERHLPKFLSCINEETGSPRAAIAAQLLLTVLLSFINVNRLIDYVAFVMVLQKVAGIAALLWIRFKKIPVNASNTLLY
ncbi:unnamed protein product [Thelazia callipaeda]|uniref:AA_permease domain-containing protein n=1 Tax=Thelazia callipaeda TaxID=103827 RepID=A0A0N5CUB5_THECL|nr:unnamed protein product [Thelazia callipaeda]